MAEKAKRTRKDRKEPARLDPEKAKLLGAAFQSLEDARMAAGLTPGYFAAKERELLEATETKTFLNPRTGEVVYSAPLVAHDIRLRALVELHKMKNSYPAQKLDHGGGIAHTFIIEGLEDE